MKVLALDYGSARTGVAVSDPTGTLARPLGVVERVGSDAGLAELVAADREEEPERVVVGLPLTLRGERGRAGARDARASPRRSARRSRSRSSTSTSGSPPRSPAATTPAPRAYILSSYLEWLAAPG